MPIRSSGDASTPSRLSVQTQLSSAVLVVAMLGFAAFNLVALTGADKFAVEQTFAQVQLVVVVLFCGASLVASRSLSSWIKSRVGIGPRERIASSMLPQAYGAAGYRWWLFAKWTAIVSIPVLVLAAVFLRSPDLSGTRHALLLASSLALAFSSFAVIMAVRTPAQQAHGA